MMNITKPFIEKEFLEKLSKKETHFCRLYMNGSKEKTMKLYKKFVNTTLFRKYLHDKKKECALLYGKYMTPTSNQTTTS